MCYSTWPCTSKYLVNKTIILKKVEIKLKEFMSKHANMWLLIHMHKRRYIEEVQNRRAYPLRCPVALSIVSIASQRSVRGTQWGGYLNRATSKMRTISLPAWYPPIGEKWPVPVCTQTVKWILILSGSNKQVQNKDKKCFISKQKRLLTLISWTRILSPNDKWKNLILRRRHPQFRVAPLVHFNSFVSLFFKKLFDPTNWQGFNR